MKNTLVRLGTSGYSYRDWIGTFYPEGTSQRGFLEFYSRHFDFVEINSSFYRMPDASLFARMRSRVSPGFTFSVKAPREFTHGLPDGGLPGPGQLRMLSTQFRDSLAPLREAQVLEAVLLQFPFRFRYKPENRRYLAAVIDSLAELPVAVELRHTAWYEAAGLGPGLAERGAVQVQVDLPPLPDLPSLSGSRPHTDESLRANMAYLRLHGRRTDTWWTGTNESRYHYSYPDSELSEFARIVSAAIERGVRQIVAFNNHFEANAARDAARLRRMLWQETPKRQEDGLNLPRANGKPGGGDGIANR